MSQQYKSKYDQLRENSQSTEPETEIPDLSDNGPVRNICFVLEDGSMTFLNYGYLISGSIDTDKQKIKVSFTTYEVELEGYKLDRLFYELLQFKTKIVVTNSKRYEKVAEAESFIVVKIILTKT